MFYFMYFIISRRLSQEITIETALAINIKLTGHRIFIMIKKSSKRLKIIKVKFSLYYL